MTAHPARFEVEQPRTAIIDIGSNSIRLVVYQGPARLPTTLFNEKVLAGLGRSLAATGSIDADAMAAARAALHRFAALVSAMEVSRVRTVATAAVRDASNGAALIDMAAAAGLSVEILSGEEEAAAAGYGVLSGIPGANGIVGDLGGGSLELVRIRKGELGERVSFPLGVLRLAPLRERGRLDRVVETMLRDAGWIGAGKNLPFYLVGGSWRGLARLAMHRARYPLPIIHQYAMSPDTITSLRRTLSQLGKPQLKDVPGLSSGRIPTLPDAAALLSVLLKHLKSSTTIVSAFGLREGLLFQELDARTRAEDPLIAAARDEARLAGRFPEHGDLLDRWIAPLFGDDKPAEARLRNAACQLADVGWRANPEFRAERGHEIALHGNWVGVDGRGRAMMAQALWTAFGGAVAVPDVLTQLAPEPALRRAATWGQAIRLGQRLSAGVAEPLRRSHLTLDATTLRLDLDAADHALYGETVAKRHSSLATALGRTASSNAAR
ncbi:Ppx/GppA family phosphatase [Sphingomonas sp. RHCKR47]|uniref:Ppx/GppA family phosphatase n=1 Tax=Sphingomonas citricola TaxID=2862498 RepID=UPI001CA49D64|nr:Ppx/GppA family phosphatase [Sphingomonas citricola]MBW6523662.1 Ppx/GppA family phosphatase [Sphingomonas citricola]